jgi:hypothetical protein
MSKSLFAPKVFALLAIILTCLSLATPVLFAQWTAKERRAQEHARDLSKLYAVCHSAGLTLPAEPSVVETLRKFLAAGPVLRQRGIEVPALSQEEADAASAYLCHRSGNLQVTLLSAQ